MEEYPAIDLISNDKGDKFTLNSSCLKDAFINSELRSFGNLVGMSVWLNPSFNWKIVKDNEDELCLIAYDKEVNDKE